MVSDPTVRERGIFSMLIFSYPFFGVSRWSSEFQIYSCFLDILSFHKRSSDRTFLWHKDCLNVDLYIDLRV